MKFLLGVAIGAVGAWAYMGGKLQGIIGAAPAPVQEAVNTGSERLNQAMNSDAVRQVTATVQDKVNQVQPSPIVTPSAAEVATRPTEPLPRQEPA
jgi:hypothetical protein